MEPHDVRRGRIAYEAYAVSTGGKTYDGREMPSWGELPEKIRAAWVVAATVVYEDTKKEIVDTDVLPSKCELGTCDCIVDMGSRAFTRGH